MTQMNPTDAINRIADLVTRLHTRMLALDDDGDKMPLAEIEKTAKTINQLIVSMDKVDAFIRQHGDHARIGDRPTGERRRVLLRKIRRMVENGILDELDD